MHISKLDVDKCNKYLLHDELGGLLEEEVLVWKPSSA